MAVEDLTRDLQLIAADLAGTPYDVRARLGRGGMGDVVEVWHRHLEQRMALKVLLRKMTDSKAARDRFRSEAKTLTRIAHTNLLRVTDLGETRSRRPFLVCELLEGEPLSTLVKVDGALPPREAVDYAIQALDGLGAAHARGVIHRDIKPANLFVCSPDEHGRRTIKVLDFGIAKYVAAEGGGAPTFAPEYSTQEGVLVGTPHYAAPEQALSRPIDQRTDVYAMGCVLFFMLTGKRVFQEHILLADLLKAHVRTPPDVPSNHALEFVSQELDAAVLRALAKRPDDRFSSAKEMAEALRDSMRNTPVTDRNAHGTTVKMAEACEVEPKLDSTLPIVSPEGTPQPGEGAALLDEWSSPLSDTTRLDRPRATGATSKKSSTIVMAVASQDTRAEGDRSSPRDAARRAIKISAPQLYAVVAIIVFLTMSMVLWALGILR